MFWIHKTIVMKILLVICMSSRGGCDRRVQCFRGSGFPVVINGYWPLATGFWQTTNSFWPAASSKEPAAISLNLRNSEP